MAYICFVSALGTVLASSASAQSNPFVPPQGGMSRAQIQEIVRQEVERNRQVRPGQPGAPTPAGSTPAVRSQIGGGVQNLPQQQGGTPQAGTAATPQNASAPQPATPVSDPVADLLKEGGVFVGCISGTPIFKDRIGRRAYFTTRELRESNEARRFTRCR